MNMIDSFVNWWSSKGGLERGYGDSQYSDRVTLDSHPYLSYDECKDIYLHWPLGKRVVTSLTNFALSAKRDISFNDLPIQCVKLYEDTLDSFKVVQIVKQAGNYARMYGMSAIFVAHKKVKPNKPLSYDDLNPNDLSFNVLDPLNLAGIQINQDPTSVAYQKVTKVIVNGQNVHPTRILILFNDIPLYLRWIPSTYSWGSPSVFENMKSLIKSWNRCVIALERMATKAGSIIVKHRDSAVLNSITVRAAEATLDQIRNMQNDGIASLEKDASIELFNLTGCDVVDSIIEQMNKLILLALADTPSNILLDKNLAEGFAEGSEDAKVMTMAIDSFRERSLTPAYKFLDFYLLRTCFRQNTISQLKADFHNDLKTVDSSSLKEKILQGYSWEYGSLIPEKDSEKAQTLSTHLDTLGKLKEMGANLADIESIVNTKIKPYDTQIEFSEHSDSLDSHNDSFNDDSNSFSSSPTASNSSTVDSDSSGSASLAQNDSGNTPDKRD